MPTSGWIMTERDDWNDESRTRYSDYYDTYRPR